MSVATPALSGGARAVARCDALGVPPYSEMESGLYRGYLTPAYRATQDRLAQWMAEAGMRIEIDAAANLIGHYEGARAPAPALLIGSHIDSVRDGGCYDGPLGVMLGVELVAALHAQGRRMPFPIEVIAFGDEEGSRFPSAMLTSRAVAGTLDPAMLELADADGTRLDTLIDIRRFSEARHAPALAYLEAHIEQGPVLESEGLAVGTVTGIAAQLRCHMRVEGMAGHAGTTTMPLRHDALAGAAEMVLAVERIAREDNSDLVATVGKLNVMPGAANVIPGAVSFTLDIRSGDGFRRDRGADAIVHACRAIAVARQLDLSVEMVHDLPASPCDPALMDLLDEATVAEGHPVRRLLSGAGHDAMIMAALCPTAMVFIRCRGGISHNPAESVEPADAEAALRVMTGFVERLGETFDAD